MPICRAFLAWACILMGSAPAFAQQAAQWVHNQGLGDSFFESMGVGFGFNIHTHGNVVGLQPNGQFTPNGDIQFRQGNAAGAPLGLGGLNPAGLGFAVLGHNVDLLFNFSFEQGSSRVSSSTAVGVTTMNGGTGSIFSGSQRPFVTGLVPVVGEMNQLPVFPVSLGGGTSPVAERVARLGAGDTGAKQKSEIGAEGPAQAFAPPAGVAGSASTASRGDVSVAEIRAQQAAAVCAREAEIAELVARAVAAEEAGKPGVARVYYRRAADRAVGSQHSELLQKWQALGSAGSAEKP